MANLRIYNSWYKCDILASKWHGWRLLVQFRARLDYDYPVFEAKSWVWKWRVRQ